MALRYSRLGSTLKVVNKGEKEFTAASTDELAVIDLTAAPYAHGIRSVLFTLQHGSGRHFDSDMFWKYCRRWQWYRYCAGNDVYC